jgi:transposase
MAGEKVYIGVDVSKERLDVYDPDGKGPVRVANKAAQVRRLVKGAARPGRAAVFCCESTGGYERTLVEACWSQGVPVCVMNARQVRSYAGHLGLLEKTDRIDARVVSMAASDKAARRRGPHEARPPDGAQRRLKELWTLRARLAGQRDACRNRLGHLRDAFAVRAAQAVAGCIERQVAAIERECAAVIGSDAGRAALHARLQAVTGVGPKTATAVAALLPEVAALGDKPLAKLAGVAPLCDQSGELDGPRHIREGRRLVRNALYFAALVASRRNAVLKEVYQRFLARGKPKKAALVIVMHKLLRLFRLIAQNPDFVPARA